jgi:hypothetical protein
MSDSTEERWLTYRELGEVLRCTPNAARMHAHRRGWSRRAPNRVGDPARVLVPDTPVVRDRATHVVAQRDAQPNGAVRPDVQAHVQVLEALREQLAIANARADRAEGRIDELLADRRREADERRKLLALLTGPRAPWWRRWFR